MKALLGWLGRTGLLYLILCAAFAFYILAWPAIAPQFSSERLREDAMSGKALVQTYAQERVALQARLNALAETYRVAPGAAIDRRLSAARAEQAEVQAEIDQGGGVLDGFRPSRRLAHERRKLHRDFLNKEIATLQAARRDRSAEDAFEAARDAVPARRPTEDAVLRARQICTRTTDALARFERRYDVDRGLRNLVLDERSELTAARNRACNEAKRLDVLRRNSIAAHDAYQAAKARYKDARKWAVGTLTDNAGDLDRVTLRDVAVRAALALLAILLAPFAIRTLFYYVLAPIAERRRAIRIAVPDTAAPGTIAQPAASQASIRLTLEPGEEALVRQGFLQSSAGTAHSATHWLLTWRKPLVSLASGMAFLTRVRGTGTATGISDEANPFAELTVIDLPPGTAIVLRPRALAAVVQPQDRPLLITSHWRLFNLNAWLTLQLRFLAFHGPCRLAVRGGRGVRVEPVEKGRVFGQDQMTGFSASVVYSVRRNETFAPYLFGRAPLFRDRVEGGDGIVIIEEAPMAGRRKGLRAGLEGTFDAALKAVGI